jgi:hypothetical protein
MKRSLDLWPIGIGSSLEAADAIKDLRSGVDFESVPFGTLRGLEDARIRIDTPNDYLTDSPFTQCPYWIVWCNVSFESIVLVMIFLAPPQHRRSELFVCSLRRWGCGRIPEYVRISALLHASISKWRFGF